MSARASPVLVGRCCRYRLASSTDSFACRYPDVEWRTDALVADDDGVFCGGGIYACVDLSLYLIEKLCGRETALECAKALHLEMPRTHQAGFAVPPLATPHTDDGIREAAQWIRARFPQHLRVEEIAAMPGMSRRTFERRFRSATGLMPLAYLQALRIGAAKHLLEAEPRSIQQAATEVGYDDVHFFRRLFKRHTGLTPAGDRERFGRAPVTMLEPA